MLDCNCSKCSGKASTEDEFDVFFEECLNRKNDLQMRKMSLDMRSPFDFLISMKFWLSIAAVIAIAVLI
jgi:hypothetical protein